MTRVISFVSRKGGVGKSTLTIETAIAALQTGRKVALIDLDPQGSVLLWNSYRERHANESKHLSIQKASHLELPALVQELKAQDVGWILIDTPGQETGVVSAAIQESDLALVPTRASVLDLEPAAATVEHAMRLCKPFAYVFNLTRPGKAVEELREALEAARLPVCPVTIPERTEFLAGFGHGQGILEFRPKSAAAKDVQALWEWIKGNS